MSEHQLPAGACGRCGRYHCACTAGPQQMYRGQPPTEEWVQRDGMALVVVPLGADGVVQITSEAFANLMARAGFVRIASTA